MAGRPLEAVKAEEYAPGATMPGAVRAWAYCSMAGAQLGGLPPSPPLASPSGESSSIAPLSYFSAAESNRPSDSREG